MLPPQNPAALIQLGTAAAVNAVAPAPCRKSLRSASVRVFLLVIECSWNFLLLRCNFLAQRFALTEPRAFHTLHVAGESSLLGHQLVEPFFGFVVFALHLQKPRVVAQRLRRRGKLNRWRIPLLRPSKIAGTRERVA